MQPSRYRGRRHDYVFYPVAWTDESTGTSYEKGYYDENGTRYDNVSFEKDGRYENVVCHCPYCEQDSILNLSSEEVNSFSLKCPECGAPMELKSELDQMLEAQTGADYETASSSRSTGRRKPRRLPFLLLIILVIYFIGNFVLSDRGTQQGGTLQLAGGAEEDYYNLGDTISLKKSGSNVYTLTDQGGDKELIWNEDYESYYDEDSDCYLWYNVDVDPPIWQYWYEGISSDYGDYGWMEHDKDGWYIEASQNNWVKLPSRYSTANLWYIAE